MAKTNAADTNEKPDNGDAPLIDLNEASLKKLIARAKKRGIITVDELNDVTGEMSTDQIEDVMSALSDMGVNVVENEESDEDEPAAEADQDSGLDDNADGDGGTFVVEKKKETVDRTDDPVRMYLREMGAVELLTPRGRDRDRQAHRGRPRHDDLGAVRKPDHLQRDHRMVERAQQRPHAAARDPRSRGDALQGPDARTGRRRRRRRRRHLRIHRRPRPSRRRKRSRKRPRRG
jgi:hypothetical protein